jgi:pulcherriminic acid synthase
VESIPVAAPDLHETPYLRDPFATWERLRHEQPLFHDTVDDRWLLTRYDDVIAVLADPQTYSTLPYQRIFSDVIGPTMVEMDGPEHDVRRAIVAPELVGERLLRDFAPLVDAVVADLLADLPGEGAVDIVDRLSRPLPLRVVAQLLGLERTDERFLADTTASVIDALAGVEPARSEGIAAYGRFADRIAGLVAERVERPGSDLVSGIARGRTATGEALPATEIPSFIALLLVAGGETTDRALVNFLSVLMGEPEIQAAVERDPALLQPAFSEFMRRDGVVVYEDRELTADVELHGVHLRPGQIVRVGLMSANHDETVFADPARFDLARADLRLGKERRAGGRADGVASHVGFGVGKHFCIGYQLARLEIISATERLLALRPGMRPAPGTDLTLTIEWFHRYLLAGLVLA